MAEEHRRVAAESAAHAQGLTDNLVKQGFALESRTAHQWVLRKRRRRGDQTVVIMITQPSMIPPTSPPTTWAPPSV